MNSKFKILKTGFTLVELLVVIAILAVLSVGAYIGIQYSGARNLNEKVTSDLQAIESALNQYRQDNGHYPNYEDLKLGEDKNVLCFDASMAYTHACETAAFLQTQVDNQLLTKRYLTEVPTDPRSNSRYAYGVTGDGQFYEVAGIQEQKDGTWTAKVIGNLDDSTTFPSLIRAYDAPNFVTDGGSFLPYSENSQKITARLNGVTGTVTVNGVSAVEGQKLEVSDKVKTAAGSTVILYVSDGSITYLDENSELELLPNSETTENSKNNIVTKVRMKLFEGAVWNKVVRLSSESEFNIETTSAIAGVRGTEFGVNAATNEVTILSGAVASRLKTAAEKTQSNAEGQYLVFDKMQGFIPSQEAKGTGDSFNQYKIPAQNQALGVGVKLTDKQANEYRLKYYQDKFGLSAAYVPYIVKAQAHANGSYTIYITFNGVESNGDLTVDGVDIYGESQTAGIRALKADMKPLLSANGVTYNPQEKAYAFELNTYAKTANDPLYNKGEDQMESILVQASYDLDGKKTSSQLSWPAIGLEPSPKAEYAYTFDNKEAYPNVEGLKDEEPLAIKKVEDPTVALNESGFLLESTQACDWSVTGKIPNSGAFVNGKNSLSAQYKPLDPALDSASIAVNVGERFKNNASEKVMIKCTDPKDAAKFDQVELTVNYTPKSISDVYQYSYMAKVGTSWELAHTDKVNLTGCGDITEGGHNDWTLPSKITYESVDFNKEKMNLCLWDEVNKACSDQDMLKAKNFVLQEEQEKTLKGLVIGMGLADLSGVTKDQMFQSVAFRCVRIN